MMLCLVSWLVYELYAKETEMAMHLDLWRIMDR